MQLGTRGCKAGLALDPNSLRLTMKLANAYLYLGDFSNAQAIYLQHRNDAFGNTTFAAGVLRDFERYRAAGVDSPDVARIEALLKPATR